MTENTTTIRITIKFRDKLDKLKLSKRETYQDLLERLIKEGNFEIR